MEIGRVTSKGQLVIALKLLKKHGINLGTKIICHDEVGGIKIIPAVTTEEVYSNIGFMKTNGKMLKAFLKEKKNNL